MSKARQIVDLLSQLVSSASITEAEAMVQEIIGDEDGTKREVWHGHHVGWTPHWEPFNSDIHKTIPDWCKVRKLRWITDNPTGIMSAVMLDGNGFDNYVISYEKEFLPEVKSFKEWCEIRGLKYIGGSGMQYTSNCTEKEFDSYLRDYQKQFHKPLVTEDGFSYFVNGGIYDKRINGIIQQLCKEILK
jgi:hypothetical protein